MLDTAKARNVKMILQESYYPDATAKLVAEKAGATVLFIPSGPDVRGGQTWFAWMEGIVGMLDKGGP